MNSFIECYKKMMKNYVNFNGRTTRADFWKAVAVYFVLNLIVGIPSFIISFIQGFNAGYSYSASGVATATGGVLAVLGFIFGLIETIFALAHLLPLLAMEARRLHDINKSAWFLLLYLLVCCAIGPIILIVFYCLPAVEEGKQYGDYV